MLKFKKILILFLIFIITNACKSSDKTNSSEKEISKSAVEVSSDIVLGAERLSDYLPLLSGKRVGLVVNQTSVINQAHLVDTLLAIGVNITKVFAPEHGFRGDHSAGAKIKSTVDSKTGLPILSLYGATKKPTVDMIADLDVLLFDIQDVGVRFYTYISTMHYVMEAAAENNKQVVVLDRPNPNGFYVDGPVLDLKYQSFIGMHQIPIVHGLTVGELALMINAEGWLKNDVPCDLRVISCKNYNHSDLYQLPIKPSPNLPNMNSVYLYPYLGLFEGTNVSIGRGTSTPFQIVGRPGYNGSISFTPKSLPGISDNPKYKNVECGGEVVNDVTDSLIFANPHLNLDWLLLFYNSNASSNGDFFKSFFYKLTGTERMKSQIEQGLSEDQIRLSWAKELQDFKVLRKKYLLYP